jgi:hypothetical protein
MPGIPCFIVLRVAKMDLVSLLFCIALFCGMSDALRLSPIVLDEIGGFGQFGHQ